MSTREPATGAVVPAGQSPVTEVVGVAVVHGVGEADAGWINDWLIPRLAVDGSGFDAEWYSRFSKLPDTGPEATAKATFPVHLRGGQLTGGRRVEFLEVYWADLSKATVGGVSGILATLRLFFEAPHIAAHAMLSDGLRGFDRLLRTLILWAITLLRGPITGLNICFIAVAAATVLHATHREQWSMLQKVSIFEVAAGVLGLLALAGLVVRLAVGRTDIAWGNLGTATATMAAVLLAVFATDSWHMLLRDLETPGEYYLFFRKFLITAWLAWAVLLLTAIILVALRGLFRAGRDERHQSRFTAAVAASVAQSGFWLAVLPLTGIVLLQQAQQLASEKDFVKAKLSSSIKDFTATFAIDLACIASVLLSIVIVGIWRRGVTSWYRADLAKAADRMPRLIANRLVVLAIIAGAIVLGPIAISRSYQQVTPALVFEFSTFAAVSLYGMRYLWLLYNARAAWLAHIARDLVNHHYAPTLHLDNGRRWMSRARTNGAPKHPRRERIQTRLVTALDLLAREMGRADPSIPRKLVLVAHSQGTVVLLDYLSDPQKLATQFPGAEVRVITLGSPIGHIYGHYFHEYDDIPDRLARLGPAVVSWRNLYRVDDPIAHAIQPGSDKRLVNEALPAGGHTDYWQEPLVQAAILEAIGKTPATPTRLPVLAAS